MKKNSLVRDHKGNEFPSITAMCTHYGVTRNAFNHRMARGATLQEALTKPVRALEKHSFRSDKEREEYRHAYRVNYYREHRDKALADSKAYYQAHLTESLAYQAKYRKQHNDYYRGYQAAKKKYLKKGGNYDE